MGAGAGAAAGAATGAGLGAGGADGAAGEERLKAEFIDGDVMGGDCTGLLGAGGAAAGIERSSRSFMPEAGAAGFDGTDDAVDVNEDQSPKPLDVLVVRF